MDFGETAASASALIAEKRLCRRDLLVILAAGVVVCAFNLGQNAVWKMYEPRQAMISAEMAERGDFLVPRRLGQLYPDKPPTMHVGIALLYRAFGKVSMGLARTPSAVAGIVGALVLYGIGQILYDRRTALFAGLALLGTFGWAERARVAKPDALLAAAILVASWSWLVAMRKPAGPRRTIFFAVGGLAAGLATLTKGPYGILFPLLVVWLTPIRREDLRRPHESEWLVIVATWGAIPLAWAIPVYLRDQGEYLRMVLFRPELMLLPRGPMPFYWYLLQPAPLYILPWTLFLPLVVKDLREYSAAPWIAVAIFVVLSCVPNKDEHYLLPWCPFTVLAIAAALIRRDHIVWLRRVSWSVLGLALVFLPLNFGILRPWLRGEQAERTFAKKVFDMVPEGALVTGYALLSEAVSLMSYEQGQPHKFIVKGSSDGYSLVGAPLAQQVRGAFAEGRPCYLVVRDKERKQSFVFLRDVRSEEVFSARCSGSTCTLYHLLPP